MESQILDRFSDTQLVHRLAEGDIESLGVLFDRHLRSIHRFLWFLGVASADIDEVAQRTFLRAHLAARQFDGSSSVKNWLLALATQMARSYRRSPLGAARRLSSWMMGPRKPRRLASPVELARWQLEADFARALPKLSTDQREVFALVTVEHLNAAEAAALLGVSLDTVWQRLHEARFALIDVMPFPIPPKARRLDGVAALDEMMTHRPFVGRRSRPTRTPRAAIFALALVASAIPGYLLTNVGFLYSLGDRVGFVQKVSDRGRACETYEATMVVGNSPPHSGRRWSFAVRDKRVAERIAALAGRRVALHYEQRKGVLSRCVGSTEYFVTAVRTLD